jgi:hypothetical protein
MVTVRDGNTHRRVMNELLDKAAATRPRPFTRPLCRAVKRTWEEQIVGAENAINARDVDGLVKVSTDLKTLNEQMKACYEKTNDPQYRVPPR